MNRPARRASAPPALPGKLAQQILAYIADHRLERDTHLGEERLAASLKVSRTPVRAALDFLAAMGVVEKRPHKGYFVTAEPGSLVAPPLVADSGEDAIYYRIVEDRLAGSLPEKISELELMRRYGVTKSWLANLLRRMSQEGWIERLPGKGWGFLPVLISEEAYAKMYEFRLLVEPAALLQADFSLSAAELARLRGLQQAMLDGGILRFSRAETFQIGAQFHETIVAGAHNPFFTDAIQRMNRVRRLLDYRTHGDRSRLAHTCKEHLELLDLIEANRLQAAADLLREHIEHERRIKVPLTRPDAASPAL